MPSNNKLPRFSRVEFYCLTEDAFIAALAGAITAHADRTPDATLSEGHAAVVAWSRLATNVANGGFEQFFYNHRGDWGVEPLADLLDTLEWPKVAAVLRDAVAVYRRHRAAFAVANPWDGGLFGTIPEFDKLDRGFLAVQLRGTRAMEKWVRSHIAELAVDEAGHPFVDRFTGTVEIKHPNGQVRESLEVKNGKPHGAYREFFDDGSVRNVTFYKSGKVTGDYWPDGQLKRKEMKRGPLTVIEWYYPGGQLQKRFVQNKDGYAAEPIRVFHENGQLAEELIVVQGKKTGPWLKFFADGAPQLRAEYAADEKLIVHDAWDADRNQTVKDGAGTFREDHRTIDTPYDVCLTFDWRWDRELKDGIPHGKTTTYHGGVLWSVSYFVNGVEEGESTLYWDTGRVRSVTKFVAGKAGKTKEFPKYDHPVPAVVLTVEANESLYTAWEHIRVDEYPRVLNFDEVQRRLVVPDFLREVDERNRTGTRKSDYEDWSTFNDGIAYFLTVNETGEVTAATANGSGVYSGGEWETYPPLLRTLRFEPGRIRGRAVECRVLARVDHTFVERSRLSDVV